MNILTLIGRILTLPGAYVRVFWEQLTASLLALPVTDTRFLQADKNAGHIRHGEAPSLAVLAVYNLIPGLLQLILGLPIWIVGFSLLVLFWHLPGEGQTLLFAVGVATLYLGSALLSSLFPSRDDAAEFAKRVKESESTATKVFGYPIAAVLKCGALLERTGLTTIVPLLAYVTYFLVGYLQ
ncbi:MAG: hypothetical protein LBN05_02795 [Oscillospiraceae bacterium]|jgi:hypothetical protein|nr:hypothetical protein [Oscillospiraceae bacterium]